nr:NAD(P)/FAD-dependent oxidoreductase [uncultured Cetobacterium sp.]
MKKFDLIVIGGGPGGIFGAITAADRGFKVALLEKNSRIGNKILVAGSGKCNLTHIGKPKEFLDKFGENGKFLKESLNKFSPEKLKEFFKERGLPLVLIEESGKYFPETFSSLDVVQVLKNELESKGVHIVTNVEIEDVLEINNKFHVKTEKDEYMGDKILIATGGKSYPGTGTTGDGYIYAKGLGHKIIPPQPALAPIFVKNYPFSDLSGISFQNVKVTFWKDNKKAIEKYGAVLLTHTNFSGPGILDNSRYVENGTKLEINYIGEIFEKVISDFIDEVNSNGKIGLKKYLGRYNIPERFIKTVLSILEISENTKIAEIGKNKRDEIFKFLTSNKMEITRVGKFEEAMVTKGGVSLEEVNGKTMESKLVKGLYFAGEVLDIDGDTGGYNIQAACSMGVLAGRSM